MSGLMHMYALHRPLTIDEKLKTIPKMCIFSQNTHQNQANFYKLKTATMLAEVMIERMVFHLII